ncbi:hypothetical protein [Desulfovulcanus sp.]
MRMLIVEDNSINQKLMTKLLSEFGRYDVAKNGQKAINFLTKILDETL